MLLFGHYEGVIGYYSCYHHSPLPSPSPFPSLQDNLANIEISRMPKHRLVHFSKWLRLEKLVDLPPSLDNISLMHPQQKDLNGLMSLPLHLGDPISRTWVRQ